MTDRLDLRRRVSWRRMLALAALLCLGLVGGAQTVESPVAFDAASGQAIVKLGEVDYIGLEQFLGRFGLQATWLETGKRLKFESAWTRIEFEVDSREISYNERRVFLCDGILMRDTQVLVARWDAQNLLAPLLKPEGFTGSARPVKRIMIDAGHGGKDGGTTNSKLKLMEKTFALDVSQRLGAILSSQGFDVRYTREDDTYLSLAERAILTNTAQADLFVSIHFNAAGKTTVSGLETYTMTPQFQRSTSSAKSDPSDNTLEPGHTYGPWNTILGFSMHRALMQKLKVPDRGLKRARFAVLRLAECPAVLVEAGYLSNLNEARMIATTVYRAEIAEGLANGITAYANQLSALASAP